MTDNEKRLYALLDKLGITYTVHRHQAFYTVAEADEKGYVLPGLNLKNLFIRDKKTGEHYLVILDDHRRLDFKAFGEIAGWKKGTFAGDEELMACLGLTPGSVSPFGLINDMGREVIVVLERAVAAAPEDALVNFHPNVNTATIAMKKKDFLRFLEHMGNRVVMEE